LGNVVIRGRRRLHCGVGRAAAVFSVIALAMGTLILLGKVPIPESATANKQFLTSSKLPEVETTTFMNQTLLPIEQQNNFAIKGTQVIDRNAYRLKVTGLVERNVTATYDDLLKFPAYAEVSYLPCVGGWGFWAKWTGFRVVDLLDTAGVKPGGQYVLFKCADGYTTALPLSYLRGNQTLLAYGLNDVTLPMDRGFPLQLVADSKYGYKWAKWVVEIEVVAEPVLGFWESSGYSDSADVGSPPLR
jgi:DMSO/TMAO reductase YedYZ molybdopterin-dependent catalytic subunit